MPRNIIKMLLFAVLVAIAASILPFAAKAQGEGFAADRFCETNGWTITLLGGYPMEATDRCPGAGNWEYRYEVCMPGTNGETCKAIGLARVNLAIPDCRPGKVELTKAIGCKEPLLTFPVGNGDTITKFERGDQFVYAARLPYWGPRIHERSFCANTETLDETSMCLDRWFKPTLDCCKILGPACPGGVSIDTTSNTFGPDKWVFVKTNPSLKCPDLVYGCSKGQTDEECINPVNIIPGVNISSIIDSTAPQGDQQATIATADGECIVWAQFGDATTRCAIIGGIKYCR